MEILALATCSPAAQTVCKTANGHEEQKKGT